MELELQAPQSPKPSLLGMPVGELPSPDKATFRQQQLAHWLYVQGASSFDAMTNLPKDWRTHLSEHYTINPFTEIARFPSQDASVRYLFTLQDGKQTEAVYMPYANRKTICLSSMVGCPAGCAFCATGALGFGRNLSTAEMVGQLLAVAWEEGFAPPEIRNAVLMGMGEALLNYDNALAAIRTMIDPVALDMSPRRITLSTVGLPNRIRRLTEEGLALVLAISLHAPDEETRKRIIPTAHAYPLADIIASLHDWQSRTQRRITIEYTMLKGINDALWQAELLAKRLAGLKVHINLIPFNPWQASGFVSSDTKTIQSFQRKLEQLGLTVSVRFSRGRDAGGACGQLALGQRAGKITLLPTA